MCLEEAEDLMSDFEKVISNTSTQSQYEHIVPSPLKINTMTLVCKTNLTPFFTKFLKIKEYIKKFPIENGINLSEKSLGNNALIFKWKQNYETHVKNVAVKVFGNGSLHITGVTSPAEAVIISDYFSSFFLSSSKIWMTLILKMIKTLVLTC